MRGNFEPVPFRVRKHFHTQVYANGMMKPIPLFAGGGGDGDSEPDHDGGHGSDGDGN